MTPKYSKGQKVQWFPSGKVMEIKDIWIDTEKCIQPQYQATNGHWYVESELIDECPWCGSKLDEKGDCTDPDCE